MRLLEWMKFGRNSDKAWREIEYGENYAPVKAFFPPVAYRTVSRAEAPAYLNGTFKYNRATAFFGIGFAFEKQAALMYGSLSKDSVLLQVDVTMLQFNKISEQPDCDGFSYQGKIPRGACKVIG